MDEQTECSVSVLSWPENKSMDPLPPSIEMAVTNNVSAQNSLTKGHHTTLPEYERTRNVVFPFVQGAREEEDKVRIKHLTSVQLTIA